MSDEIKSGFAKLPLWLQDFVKQKKITGFDAYLWAVLNNVKDDYRYRVSALVNQGYPIDQLKLSLKRLAAQNLVREIKKHGRWIEWEAIDLEIERWKIHQSLVENPLTEDGRWWKIHQSLVENPLNVSGKSTTNKNNKNIDKKGEGEEKIIATPEALPRAENSDRLDALKLINLWNHETAGKLPKINQLHLGRQSIDMISTQIIITPEIETWKSVFSKLKKSSWAISRQIGFLWVMNPINRDKAISGMYDNAPETRRPTKKLLEDNPDDKL